MRHGVLVNSANTCVSVAHELLVLITGNTHLGDEVLPAPWYNVFCTRLLLDFHPREFTHIRKTDVHSAAIVILIGYLCSPEYITVMDEVCLMADYKNCQAFFSAYESHSKSARRCRRTLDLAARRVLRRRHGEYQGHRLITIATLIRSIGYDNTLDDSPPAANMVQRRSKRSLSSDRWIGNWHFLRGQRLNRSIPYV